MIDSQVSGDLQAAALLDASGLESPWTMHWAKKRIETLPPGRLLIIVSTDPGSVDEVQNLVESSSNLELVSQEGGYDDCGRRTFTHLLRRYLPGRE